MQTIPLSDSHAHLLATYHKLNKDLGSLQAAYTITAGRIMDVAIGVDDWEERQVLHQALGPLPYSLGLYPSYAQDPSLQALIDTLEKQLTMALASNSSPRAIGETGIDRFRDYGDGQIELFLHQVQLGDQYKLPVIIHSRESALEILRILQKRGKTVPGIMHCWSGPPELVDECIELGMYISFAGNLTYKQSEGLAAALLRVPLDRLLLETDCPYLSPEPQRRLVNTPDKVVHTLSRAASILGMEPESLALAVARNFDAVFNVPRSTSSQAL